MTAGRGAGGAEDSRYGFGIACLLTATLFTSTAGILLRLLEEADGWTVLFYRSLFFLAALLVFILWRHGAGTARAFRAVGWAGLVVALALGSAFITFIQALLETSVANVVFITGTSPFFAALFAWIALREPVRRTIWLAMAAAFAGIAIMVSGGLAFGTLGGNLLALASCLGYAATLVAMRWGKGIDMLPAVWLAGVVALLCSALLAPGFRISAHDLGLCFLLGVFQLALQYVLVTTGSRHVPAAEMALTSRAVMLLAPLWVWIGVGEVPATTTFAGGALVLAAVLIQALLALRNGRSAAARPPAASV